MNTEKKECVRVYPPGKEMKQNLVSFKQLFSDSDKKYPNQITFEKEGTIKNLQPLVHAFYDAKNDSVNICAVVFVDAAYNPMPFTVYQKYTTKPEKGKAQIKFYVAYDLPETKTKVYNTYQVIFRYSHGEIIPKNLSTIKTYLWDIDPETSRGTTTTVEPH